VLDTTARVQADFVALLAAVLPKIAEDIAATEITR
jgi:hypothetical protein